MPFFSDRDNYSQLNSVLFSTYSNESIASLRHGGDLTRGLWTLLRVMRSKQPTVGALNQLLRDAQSQNHWLIAGYLGMFLAKFEKEQQSQDQLLHQAALQFAHLLDAQPEIIEKGSSLEQIVIKSFKEALNQYVDNDQERARRELEHETSLGAFYREELEKTLRTYYPEVPPNSPVVISQRRNDPYRAVLSHQDATVPAFLPDEVETQHLSLTQVLDDRYPVLVNFVVSKLANHQTLQQHHARITATLRRLAFEYPEPVRELMAEDQFKMTYPLFIAEIANLLPSYPQFYRAHESDIHWYNISALNYAIYAQNLGCRHSALNKAIITNLHRAFNCSWQEMDHWFQTFSDSHSLPMLYRSMFFSVRSFYAPTLQQRHANDFFVSSTAPYTQEPLSPQLQKELKSLW